MTESRFTLTPEEARLLSGRKALVTGADSGIGQGIAYELAAHGSAVAVNYLADSRVAEGMVDRIEAAGGRGKHSAVSICSSTTPESRSRSSSSTCRSSGGGG